MNQSPLHRFVLGRIEEAGRRLGAPTVTFSGRKISAPGEDIYVPNSLARFITRTSGFYLPLPPNAFGVVIFPDGTSHNMEGGVHAAPMGLYKLQYVDRHERLDFTSPISEMTTDGEKLTLKVVFRYRVVNPLIALQIDKPAEALIEHIEADVAQYIRTHDHTDIADSSENHLDSKLLSFFIQRHNRRNPLSKAFIITGIELKDFTGDNEYVQMRRKARIDESQNKIEKAQAEYQQELNHLKAQHKAENEKKATEHKAEKEKIEAGYEKERQKILYQIRLQEIELDDKRKHWQRQYNKFAKALDAVSQTISSGMAINPGVMKTITDLVLALKEEVDNEPNPVPESKSADNKSPENKVRATPTISPSGVDKVEKLTNTLLNLLNPKK